MEEKPVYLTDGYSTYKRWLSYAYQIKVIKSLRPKKILEVGVGDKTVSNYFRQKGYHITTCDCIEALKPDYVGDIRKLPFKEKSYDLVAAFEVLEHIPWEEVGDALKELWRVSQKNVVISIPDSRESIGFRVHAPYIGRLGRININIPLPFLKRKDCLKEMGHYWEMGRKGFPIKNIRKLLRERFIIKKESSVTLNPYHYFFILEKKEEE